MDFEVGSDLFILGDLDFADLNIVDSCGGATIEDTTRDNLAIAFVNGIDSAEITQSDFLALRVESDL